MDDTMKVTVLDTCCLINLYASQRPQSLIRVVFGGAIVPKQVAEEGLFIRQPGDDQSEELVPAEIHIDESIIGIVGFDQEGELERFVQLAAILDDGEAACLTIASSRKLSLATDDRKAIAVASDLGVEVQTTPEILISWIDAASPARKEIAEVIESIERYGRFRPHHTSTHAKWWHDNGPCGESSA